MSNRDRCTIDGCITPPHIFDRDGGWCSRHADERDAARRAEEKAETEAAGGPWPQTCPRRYEMFQQGGDEGQDTWDIREQMHKGLRARHCSYCGSLHPDDFMRLIQEGWVWHATDKNYKAYIGSPDGSSSMETKFYFQHLSDKQRREVVGLVNAGRVKFGPSGLYRLPFFMSHA